MLGKVAYLLIALEPVAGVGRGEVKTVTVPVAKSPIGTRPLPGGSWYRFERWPTDQQQGTKASLSAGQANARSDTRSSSQSFRTRGRRFRWWGIGAAVWWE